MSPRDPATTRTISVKHIAAVTVTWGHVPLPFSCAEPSLMGMPHAAERWTADQVRALPDDGQRYELIDGVLVVSPSPRPLHQECVTRLIVLLQPWLEANGAGRLLASPADISLGEDEILQPDLFVYRTADGKPLRDWSEIAELLLVVEILSPSTARFDRQLKRHRYQRAGVPEYWIVDLDSRLIERWHPEDTRPELLTDRAAWQPPGAPEALGLDVEALFREVWGE